MKTLIIKIDESTNSGKAFLEVTKVFATETKGVEIVEVDNSVSNDDWNHPDNDHWDNYGYQNMKKYKQGYIIMLNWL